MDPEDFRSLNLAVEHALDAAKKTQNDYINKVADAEMIDTMNRENISAVNILEVSEVPASKPSNPLEAKAIPLVFGVLIAFSAVFVKERMSPCVGDGERAGELLKLPLLAKVSNGNGDDRREDSQRG